MRRVSLKAGFLARRSVTADPALPRRGWGFRLDVPRSLAACSVILGASVLLGWALGFDTLTRVFPGMVTMKPNAALSFLLTGLALWSIREGRVVSRSAVGLSVAVATIGGLTLFEYATGVNLGIDEILFREPPDQPGRLSAGRMHPTTAFDFLLLGTASALLAAERSHRSAQGLALLAILVAGSTLTGYLYGVKDFVGLAAFHQMAFHTTVGMIVVSTGLLLSRSRQGLMIPITDDGPSGMIARWLIPVAILTPIAVGGLVMRARDAGLFDDRYGSAVRVTVVVAIFVGCIWRSADSVYRMDQERRRVECEWAEGERRFRFLAEAMPQIVWISKTGGEPEYINRRWYDYTGQDPLQKWDPEPVFHPEDFAPCQELWEQSSRSGNPFQGEYRFRRHDGSYRWHLVRAEPMRDEEGRVVQWVGTSTDVNDQKRLGEHRYRSLIEATTAIVWNTPPSGVFESDQPGWGAFTGQTFDQLRDWGWLEAIHPGDREETAKTWSAAVENRTVYQVRHRLRRYDGEYRHMVARAVPLLDDDGVIREWFGVHTDVDDQERAHEEMRAAKEAAEASTRAKGEFLANMSHEIRTPMNGVLGMTELALGTELTPCQREYLGLVKSSADALLRVIDDILDFSKIEAGKLKLEPIPFPLHDVVTEALRSFTFKANDKNLELICRIAPGVPESVVGDAGRLRQVLMNLVGNAVKFTERGEIMVTVEAESADDAPGFLRFSVADSGIGVPTGKRASIFTPFEQADNSTTRKYGGTGLGLTICARLIALMDGRIWVEDNPGGGSVFRFVARLEAHPEGAGPPAADPVVLAGLRVLIIDDNRTNRTILEEVLSQWGCRPLAVEDGLEAIRELGRAFDRGEPYALALLDRMMPGMDGFELARRVRADPRHGATRMLMLTSGGLNESSNIDELGIGGRLAKPLRQSELLNAILDMLGPERCAIPPARPEPIRPVAASTSRRLRVLLAEDQPINQMVATRMLENLGHQVTVAANGRLAVEALAASGPFDLILMDVQMPEMDGFEATAAIRLCEQGRGVRVPIVALTAHAMAGDRERCLQAGFDGYLSKPIDAAKLREVLMGYDGACLPRPSAGHDVAPRSVYDPEAALESIGGDRPLLIELLGLFFDDSSRLLGEIRAAVGVGDAPTLARLAHTIAGVGVNFAASRVAASARRLESIATAEEFAPADAANVCDELAEAVGRFRAATDESHSLSPSRSRR